jgi:thiamine-phosphate pyrophosphorylase
VVLRRLHTIYTFLIPHFQNYFLNAITHMQHHSITPSCERILQRFCARTIWDKTPAPGHLVAALLAEESLGAQRLTGLGITLSDFRLSADHRLQSTDSEKRQDLPAAADEFISPLNMRNSALTCVWCQPLIDRAFTIARRGHGAVEVSSEHLLQAMVEIDGPVKVVLADVGVDTALLLKQLQGHETSESSPSALEVDFELNPDSSSLSPRRPPTAAIGLSAPQAEAPDCFEGMTDDALLRVHAVVDANLNRAREGLRVLEDFARFVHRDEDVTCALKQLRHSVVGCERELRSEIPDLVSYRNIAADAGTGVTTTGEASRQSLADVVVANARRIQESFRSLEEFGKLLSPVFAGQIKQLRYESYDLEQRLNPAGADDCAAVFRARYQRRARLDSARLCVLISESNCFLHWRDVVETSLAGGADVVQLREKLLPLEEIVRRGRWIAGACKAHDALFIMNDRCDAAIKADADGVHIGQEDATVAEARQILDPTMLVGVSTHSRSQLLQAHSQDVDYLGVGPVFRSDTKSFDSFPGTRYVAQATELADRAWFAIGGIDITNIDVARQAGAQRVAVSNAVIASGDPEQAARQLKQALLCPAARVPDTVRLEQG